MSYSYSDLRLLTPQDYIESIGKDFRSLPDPVVHPYDPDFFQEACGDHDGYVLHPIVSDDPGRVFDTAEKIYRLIEADNSEDIDDHDLGTLSDEYSSLNSLVDSFIRPPVFTDDVKKFLICGSLEGVVGRLDYQPVFSRVSGVSPELEVSMWIADPYRERNIASYVLNRFINDMFHEEAELAVIRSQVLVGNIAARKLVEQAGFEKQGLVFEDDLEPYQIYVVKRPEEN